MQRPLDQTLQSAAEVLKTRIPSFQPTVGLILGSGLGALADEIGAAVKINYADIPGFPVSTVQGHAGKLICGSLEGKSVVAMQGRFHYYEGYPMTTIALPVRVMRLLGIRKLILTNAAGAVNPDYRPGDFMLIKDHINFGFANPLLGENSDEIGPRFPDNSQTYCPEMLRIARQAAAELFIPIREGVYQYMTGPSYETPSEVRLARQLGADAVGMSTFPEALAANHCGIDVLGISLISNMGAGISTHKLSHSEVIQSTEVAKDIFIKFLRRIVLKITI